MWVILFLAAMWALLTAGEGWWFFLLLLPVLFWWLKVYPLWLPAIKWRYVLPFLRTFFTQLASGAVDVALRAFAIRPVGQSGFANYPLRLHQPEQQQLLMTLVSLLPGTYAVTYSSHEDHTILQLHILDINLPWQAEVALLERQLGLVLGATLTEQM